MNCQEARISLQLAEDSELAEDEREALDGHLAGCLSCRRMAAWLDAVEESYPETESLDDGFQEAVLMRLRQKPTVWGREAYDEIRLSAHEPSRAYKRTWPGRLWSLVVSPLTGRSEPKRTRGRIAKVASGTWSALARLGRKREASEPAPGWSSSAAGSVLLGFRSLGPALAPSVVGQSYAMGWLRVAKSNLSGLGRARG